MNITSQFNRNSIARVLLTLALVLCAATVPAMAASGVVNINTADQQTLELLPRVGPSVAQRIIEYREEHGQFAHATDLMLVRGIGEKTFERMEAHVAVEGDSTLTEKVRVPRADATEASPSEGKAKQDGNNSAVRR